jgi:hypothetical protein
VDFTSTVYEIGIAPDPGLDLWLSATGDGVRFMPLVWAQRTRAVWDLRRSSSVASAVICAAGAWPARVALALAVSDVLRAGRDDLRPVVTYAHRPPPAARELAIPHEVVVSDGEHTRVRAVWEVTAAWYAPDWLAGLSPRPATAGMA